MPKVQIKNNQICVGSEAVPVLSGEVHYWRLSPASWADVLDTVKEMGLKIISTYIPWHYHELSPGKYDFSGKTERNRDLKAFLKLAQQKGFYVIIRPGPYIYSEWPNDGVPDDVRKLHRLHPQFFKRSRQYLSAVCKVLRPFLASNKGPIILLQADNEIDPWPDLHGAQYGLADKPGLFQDYLHSRYHGNIHELNRIWKTNYRGFEEVKPFIGTKLKGSNSLDLKGDSELCRNLDYLSFKHFFSQKVAEWCVRAYRDLGVDVPIFLNVYSFFYAHDWKMMQEVSDAIGIDFYPIREFSEDRFEHRKFMDKSRFLASVSKLPFVAEFASGVWHARLPESGVIPPTHYRMLCLSALQAGLKGWNWYMLVNRDNWYLAPINEWGRKRDELFDVFKGVVDLFNKLQPQNLEKLTPLAVTYHPMQAASKNVAHDQPVLQALYEADLDYECWNPASEKKCDKKIVFYTGAQWLDDLSQDKLKEHMESGGTLIAFKDFPRRNERSEKLNLGFEDPESILFEFKRNFLLKFPGTKNNVNVTSSVFTFPDRKHENFVADLGSYGKQIVGYIKKIGKGKLIHLGIDPSPEILHALAGFLGLNEIVCPATQGIISARFKRGNKIYILAVNNSEEVKTATLSLSVPVKRSKRIICRDLENPDKNVSWISEKSAIVAEIPRKDGRVFEVSI